MIFILLTFACWAFGGFGLRTVPNLEYTHQARDLKLRNPVLEKVLARTGSQTVANRYSSPRARRVSAGILDLRHRESGESTIHQVRNALTSMLLVRNPAGVSREKSRAFLRNSAIRLDSGDRVAFPGTTWDVLMPALARRIRQCNDVVPDTPPLIPFYVDGEKVGSVIPSVAAALGDFPNVFDVSETSITFCAQGRPEEKNDAVHNVALALRERGLLIKWRDEKLVVTTRFDSPTTALLIERALLALLGGKGYGVAVNGWCRHPVSGEQYLWVATRAPDKATWAGMLDAIAAGALVAGSSPLVAACREAAEEAGITPELAATLQPVGAISYFGVDESPIQPKDDVLFCFDLEVPWDFSPTIIDGEVAKFERMAFEDVLRCIAYGKAPGWPCLVESPQPPDGNEYNAFKPNINLVVLDFLVRHGYIPPDASGYLKLVASLRQGSCC